MRILFSAEKVEAGVKSTIRFPVRSSNPAARARKAPFFLAGKGADSGGASNKTAARPHAGGQAEDPELPLRPLHQPHPEVRPGSDLSQRPALFATRLLQHSRPHSSKQYIFCFAFLIIISFKRVREGAVHFFLRVRVGCWDHFLPPFQLVAGDLGLCTTHL